MTARVPSGVEGEVIRSTAQVLLPARLPGQGESAARLVSVQGLVTQGTPRTLLLVLAWDSLTWQLEACHQTDEGLTCLQSVAQTPCL